MAKEISASWSHCRTSNSLHFRSTRSLLLQILVEFRKKQPISVYHVSLSEKIPSGRLPFQWGPTLLLAATLQGLSRKSIVSLTNPENGKVFPHCGTATRRNELLA